jgi:CheY-like chemotaxis protein
MVETDVLVIDDEAEIRESLQLFLELDKFSVRTAAHGQEALQLLEQGLAPSVVLLDLMMPVMNGVDFLAAIRADSRFSSLPVVVVSACRPMVQELQSRQLVTHGLVPKPVDIEQLMSAIRMVCGRERGLTNGGTPESSD